MTPKLSAMTRTITFSILMLIAASCAGCKMPGMPKLPAVFAEKQYTILLHTFSGPEHVKQSKLYRDKTKELAGWSGLDVVHKNANSELYWGEYRSIDDAEDDLKTARTWKVPGVNRPAFPFPRIVLLPGHEVEIPEYDLVNADGYWTVLVAIYVDDSKQGFVGRERQRHALEYCTFLRKKGFDAYYHHMTGRSQITVGAFPERAVIMETRPSTHSNVLVATQAIKSEKIRKIMGTKDPPLCFLVVNDHTEYKKRRSLKTGKMVKVITPSRPMRIPEKRATISLPPAG